MTEEKPKLEVKLAEISKDIMQVEIKTNKLAIKDEQGVVEATQVLTIIKGRIKQIEEWRKFFVKTPTEQVRKVNTMFREKREPYEKLEVIAKRAIGTFRLEQEQKARKEEERLRKLREKREERAKEKGKELDIPTPPKIERPEATVKIDGGKTTTKKVWKFEIIDEKEVPRTYLTVDERKIRTAVANGVREIKGVRIYEDVEVSVTAY